MKRSKSFVSVILGLLFLVNVLAYSLVYDLNNPKLLEVTFFDVGQGDSIFIQTPQKHQILIDGGPSSAVLEKLAEEMPFWDRTIDLVILTHPEQSHIRVGTLLFHLDLKSKYNKQQDIFTNFWLYGKLVIHRFISVITFAIIV